MPGERIFADSESEIVEVVGAHDADWLHDGSVDPEAPGRNLLFLGGGSNLVVSDAPYSGIVISDRRTDIEVIPTELPEIVHLSATAGTRWDELVQYCVESGFSGIEALSGIPGTVGAAPVQNIGAYGHEVGETLFSVRVYDRASGEVRTLSKDQLELGYRTSALKRSLQVGKPGASRWGDTGRWVVLNVVLTLRTNWNSAPVMYGELARRLGIQVGETAPLLDVRRSVLNLRAGKGMVLDSEDHDTWSAGSFFTNPILSERFADEVLPFKAPRYPVEPTQELLQGLGYDAVDSGGLVKTSAAWLIERSGFSKGFGISEDSRARLSTKHVLAITNRGGASSGEVVDLARTIQAGVKQHFGVVLHPEPVFVGVEI